MNKRKLLLLFVIILSINILTLSALHCIRTLKQPMRDFSEIVEAKTLNVVMEYNSIDFHVAGDSIAGLQYDICQFITQRSGLTVQIFLENNLDVSIKKLEKNKYDAIARNIPITNENKQFLAFTIPITQNKQVLIQRKVVENDSISFISNQIDLAGKTIYVIQNSPAILRLKNLSAEIAEPIYVKEDITYTSEQLIYQVAKKKIDYAVVDKEIALKNADLFPDLDFSIDISFTQLQAWALRKNSPVLLDSLNCWIAAFKKEKGHS